MGLYMVLQWVGSNAYVLDLPGDMWINLVFNVANVLPYHMLPEDDAPGDDSFDDSPLDCS